MVIQNEKTKIKMNLKYIFNDTPPNILSTFIIFIFTLWRLTVAILNFDYRHVFSSSRKTETNILLEESQNFTHAFGF